MSETNGEVKNTPIDSVYVDIGRLVPNPWNPNRMNDVVRKAERESIMAFGFVDPVTVRPHPTRPEDYEIIDGEHRWEIATELGIAQVPVVVLDLDDATARKLTVVLNETRGDADAVLLAQLLSELKGMTDEDTFAVALPYTGAELDHLLTIGTEDWDGFQTGVLTDPVLPSNLRELTLTMEMKVFDQLTRWLDVLRKEYDMAETSVTEIIVEAVRRSALEANQGKKSRKAESAV